jgi:hypothetical protein
VLSGVQSAAAAVRASGSSLASAGHAPVADEATASGILDSRVELFEREIRRLGDRSSWAEHQNAVARSVTAELRQGRCASRST